MRGGPREYVTHVRCWEDGCEATIPVVTLVTPMADGARIETVLDGVDLHMVEHGYMPEMEDVTDD